MPHSLRNELWKACRADRSLVLRASVVLVLGLIANVLTPWPLKFIIDEVLGKGSLFGFRFTHFSELTSKTLLILCLTVLSFLLICSRGFFNHLRHILLTQIGDRSSDRLRVRVFAHLLKVDLTSLSHFALDDLRARANEDLDRIRDCMIEVFAVVIGELVTVIVTFAILF
jgi:ATP-binding cassette subfamily B protein